ncbi:MAG TPA: hypothetical protein VF041_00230 [Gemmatimonadaceae bacterium]
MFLEQRVVSRKTPLDGKLEISPATAGRIGALGETFSVACGGREGIARLHSMECTCAKGAGERHVHHFVESPLLEALAPGREVRVEMDEHRGEVRIEAV